MDEEKGRRLRVSQVWWTLAVAMAGAAVGFALAQVVKLPTADPAVQGAVVGALAGILGGLIGAALAVWGSFQVTNRAIRDARLARRQARLDALGDRLLPERLAAISDYESTVNDITERTLNVMARPEALAARVEMMVSVHRSYFKMILMAPDLHEPASRLLEAVDAFLEAWAPRTEGASPIPDPGVEPAVDAKRKLVGRLDGEFIGAAVENLGTHQYVERALLRSGQK